MIYCSSGLRNILVLKCGQLTMEAESLLETHFEHLAQVSATSFCFLSLEDNSRYYKITDNQKSSIVFILALLFQQA